MRIGEAFPSNFLKVDDLKGKHVVVTMAHVEVEKIGDDTKPVLHFRGKDKGLVLNKTNALTIADIVGTDEMDDWAGHQIVLHPDKTTFQGKRVGCIRIAEPPNKVKPEPEPEVVDDEADDFDREDDRPF